MAWLTDKTIEAFNWLRFSIRATGALSAFILGCFLLYLTTRLTLHLVDLLERTVFQNPW